MYEGGIREPFLVRWPALVRKGAKVEPGSDCSTPISSPDLFPTLLEAASAKPESNHTLDGVSLVPLLRGESLAERSLFWHYPHYGNQGGAPAAAIRRGDWKLIHWYEGDRLELFQLATDLGEQRNVAAREPQLVAELRAELDEWRTKVGAKHATRNPAFDPKKTNGRSANRPR